MQRSIKDRAAPEVRPDQPTISVSPLPVQNLFGPPALEPFSLSPGEAMTVLNVKHSRLYELLAAGELESYREGKARRITVRSIRARLDRLLQEAQS